jgi:hypothetical protein
MRYFQLVLLLIIFQSCKQNKDNFDVNESQSNNSEVIESANDSIINTINSFYTSYISENAKDIVNKNALKELKSKYVAKSLLDKLDKKKLDYDPFVNAQDYNIEWLKNIEITKDKLKKDTYKVCIIDNGIKTFIPLVVKKELNQYKIYDINGLPDEIIESVNKEKDIEQDITGNWKTICEDNRTGLHAFDSSQGYLDIYIKDDFARVAVNIDNNSIIKYSVLTSITRYNKFVDWLEISTDSTICKVKIINEKELELEWLGFYNKKIQRREMVKNPFTDKIENTKVILKNCK